MKSEDKQDWFQTKLKIMRNQNGHVICKVQHSESEFIRFFLLLLFIMVLSVLHGKFKEKTNRTLVPHTARTQAHLPRF